MLSLVFSWCMLLAFMVCKSLIRMTDASLNVIQSSFLFLTHDVSLDPLGQALCLEIFSLSITKAAICEKMQRCNIWHIKKNIYIKSKRDPKTFRGKSRQNRRLIITFSARFESNAVQKLNDPMMFKLCQWTFMVGFYGG